jgi:uncharacterized repeat protein (TIGR03847 family)
MSPPKLIELNRAEFITIDTVGPPGQRTFFLQATQDETLITLVIEKEHAAALSIAIRGLLEQLGQGQAGTEHDELLPINLDLIHPVRPLFRVGRLGLGYDETQDRLIIMAEELTEEGKEQQGTQVHIWGDRTQMTALAHQAAITVASGRPICQLCGEPIDAGEEHVCIKGNGRKRLYKPDGS